MYLPYAYAEMQVKNTNKEKHNPSTKLIDSVIGFGYDALMKRVKVANADGRAYKKEQQIAVEKEPRVTEMDLTAAETEPDNIPVGKSGPVTDTDQMKKHKKII